MLPELRRRRAHGGRGRGTVATRAELAEWQRGATCGDLLVGVPRARPTCSLLHPSTKGCMRSSTCTTTRVNRALVQRVLGGFWVHHQPLALPVAPREGVPPRSRFAKAKLLEFKASSKGPELPLVFEAAPQQCSPNSSQAPRQGHG